MIYVSAQSGFIFSCVFHGSPLVRAVVHYALIIANYNSVIGSNALFCCDNYGWTAADFRLVKSTFPIQIFEKKSCVFISKSETCVAYLKLYVFGKGSFISPIVAV